MINLTVLKYIGVIGAGIAAGTWVYNVVSDAATTRCENANLFAISQAVEEQRQYLLAEQDRSNQISAKLLETQRKLNETEKQYITYASAITGNCNGDDFRMFIQQVSGTSPSQLSSTPSTPTDRSTANDPSDLAYEEAVARILAANIAQNYSRLNLCVTEKRAINEFHRPKEVLNE
jgi:7-keto-8-aminopelargonate synthetase-like enzyme